MYQERADQIHCTIHDNTVLVISPIHYTDYERVIVYHVQQYQYDEALELLSSHAYQALQSSDRVSYLNTYIKHCINSLPLFCLSYLIDIHNILSGCYFILYLQLSIYLTIYLYTCTYLYILPTSIILACTCIQTTK